MSDYDDDELPPISVNTSADLSKFSIPDADILASQRAEEAAREEQIRIVRAEAAATGQLDGTQLVMRTDSSGSEGEAFLAKTLVSLRMEPPVPVVTHPRPAALLAAILPTIQGDKEFLKGLLQMLEEAGDETGKVIDTLIESICELLHQESSWGDEEVVQVCVALMCVCVGERRADAKLALRQILDNVATTKQVALTASVVLSSGGWWCGAGSAGGARGPVEGARGAAGGGGDRLAETLALEHLCTILCAGLEKQDSSSSTSRLVQLVTSSWRRLDARSQHGAVLLLGRLLRGDQCERDGATGTSERDTLLSAVSQIEALATDRNHPDRLRVTVGLSKLQLLFRAKR